MTEFKFLLPLELDLSGLRGRDPDLQRTDLLKEAVLQFDYAIGLDPDYAPAYLRITSYNVCYTKLLRKCLNMLSWA